MFKPQPFHLLQMVSWKGSRFCTSQVKFDSTRISVLNCARDMTIHVATQTLCAAYFKSDLPGVVWCMLAWPYLSSEAHKIHTMKQLWGWNRLSTVSLLERWRHSLQDARSRTAIPGNYQAAGQAKRQTGQNLLQSMCRLLMMIAKMMTSWLKNIVWNRACSSHPIRHQLDRATAQHATRTQFATSSLPFQKEMHGNAVSNRSQVILTLKEGSPECRSDRITLARMPQSTTAYFTLTGHRRGDVFLCLYCQDSWEMRTAGCICRCTAMVRWNSPC